MIKNIVKSALAAIAVIGFVFTLWFSLASIPMDRVYREILSSGISYPLSHTTPTNAKKDKYPYTYIHIPKENVTPLAITLYDKIYPEKPSTEQTIPETDIATPPPIILPEDVFSVVSRDMSENQSADNLVYKNESKYSPDINLLTKSDYPLKYSEQASSEANKAPLVLIIHTHGTECYLPDATDTYSDDTPTRSTNTELNVIAAGSVLAETLRQNGVPTIHCTIMFDEESYSKSYDLSEQAVCDYLKQYPSIQYVFDVHRDSIADENGNAVKPVTTINEIPVAQAMFVVGTDSSGAPHPNWIDNLTVASIFQYSLVKQYQTLMRPLNLRAASFNAEHTTGSVLIEIGTWGNTVTEAKECARLLGESLARIITSDGIDS